MGLRILIVDDNKDNQTLLHWKLDRYATCNCASDGDEGLKHFIEAHKRGEPYSVVFTDILMPKKGGLKVIDGIRDYEKDNGLERCKIVVTTSLDINSDMRHMLQESCDKLLVKPLPLDGINSIIEEMLAA